MSDPGLRDAWNRWKTTDLSLSQLPGGNRLGQSAETKTRIEPEN
jgi:hypothetical protein